MTSISRQKLYAMGEPLGDAVTMRKVGGGAVYGFGGDSSSRSSSDTFNTDKRVVVDSGIGISGDNTSLGFETNNSFTTVTQTENTANITDGGIVSRGLDTVDNALARAFNSINTSSANNDEGFQGLLSAVNKNTVTTADSFSGMLSTLNRSSDNNSANLQSMVGTLSRNNDTLANGFDSLMSAAQTLWTNGEKLIGQTQQSVADAYSQAQTDAKGTIDNKTIMVIAVAGAAALAFASRKK